MIINCAEKLYDFLVKNIKNEFTMENLYIQNTAFKHFKSEKYACGVRFQQSLRLCERHHEAKHYHIVKHQL